MQEAYDKSLRELVSPELMKKIRFRASELNKNNIFQNQLFRRQNFLFSMVDILQSH